MKAAPTRKSTSWRTSTALTSNSLIPRARRFIAFSTSACVRALQYTSDDCIHVRAAEQVQVSSTVEHLKRARKTVRWELACKHASRASAAMFSPSRSQSSQRTRAEAERASEMSWERRASMPRRTSLRTRAEQISSLGSQERHERQLCSKSSCFKWPLRARARCLRCCPMNALRHSCTWLLLCLRFREDELVERFEHECMQLHHRGKRTLRRRCCCCCLARGCAQPPVQPRVSPPRAAHSPSVLCTMYHLPSPPLPRTPCQLNGHLLSATTRIGWL